MRTMLVYQLVAASHARTGSPPRTCNSLSRRTCIEPWLTKAITSLGELRKESLRRKSIPKRADLLQNNMIISVLNKEL